MWYSYIYEREYYSMKNEKRGTGVCNSALEYDNDSSVNSLNIMSKLPVSGSDLLPSLHTKNLPGYTGA